MSACGAYADLAAAGGQAAEKIVLWRRRPLKNAGGLFIIRISAKNKTANNPSAWQ
ncbi:hypothetical protein ANACOL_03849 [Anaerotruncus colihominis DSM 17241]|uniref:Uncharacterized protein n=1 Tax=Anaerotruncus colihominis DSM 17241 TaxID=445972 RepID=B0PGB6_9FIRM|nr:hypothetical protein ANACOL_03849 [Anaerotruncus colihominis DSM 17241]